MRLLFLSFLNTIESNHQVQSQRDYLPALDLSINQTKQQSTTLHIGTHILSESSKDNAQTMYQTRYQLNSHLQSNTLELDDQAQTLSYEHYYPYGGTAIIAGSSTDIKGIFGFKCRRMLLSIASIPESYERLENIVRTYPANKLNLLNANTRFSIISDDSSNRGLGFDIQL
jgi:hypothetical protein